MSRDELSSYLEKLLGVLFLAAGVLKGANPGRLARSMENYDILPSIVLTFLAFYLPWLEVFAGLSLILGKMRRGSLLVLSGLTALFVVASSQALLRGIDIECGCLGGWSSLNTPWALLRALLLCLLSIWLFLNAVARVQAQKKHARRSSSSRS